MPEQRSTLRLSRSRRLTGLLGSEIGQSTTKQLFLSGINLGQLSLGLVADQHQTLLRADRDVSFTGKQKRGGATILGEECGRNVPFTALLPLRRVSMIHGFCLDMKRSAHAATSRSRSQLQRRSEKSTHGSRACNERTMQRVLLRPQIKVAFSVLVSHDPHDAVCGCAQSA